MENVRQRLLTGRPKHEADVGARGVEQVGDRVGHRAVVAPRVEPLEKRQRVDDRLQFRAARSSAERVEDPLPVPVLEQRLVVDREQRAAQRREHREFVVGPFDGGERGPHGFHFLAAVERLPADQQVRDAARLERVHVGRVTSSPKWRNRRNRMHTCRAWIGTSSAARRASSSR